MSNGSSSNDICGSNGNHNSNISNNSNNNGNGNNNNNSNNNNNENGSGGIVKRRHREMLDKDGLMNFKFDHSHESVILLTEEFIEYCSEGALSVEVYGHRSAMPMGVNPEQQLQSGWDPEEQQLAKARSLADR